MTEGVDSGSRPMDPIIPRGTPARLVDTATRTGEAKGGLLMLKKEISELSLGWYTQLKVLAEESLRNRHFAAIGQTDEDTPVAQRALGIDRWEAKWAIPTPMGVAAYTLNFSNSREGTSPSRLRVAYSERRGSPVLGALEVVLEKGGLVGVRFRYKGWTPHGALPQGITSFVQKFCHNMGTGVKGVKIDKISIIDFKLKNDPALHFNRGKVVVYFDIYGEEVTPGLRFTFSYDVSMGNFSRTLSEKDREACRILKVSALESISIEEFTSALHSALSLATSF